MIRVFVLLAALSLAISGCSDESKIKNVCTDILNTVAVDPSSLKVNGVDVHEGHLSHSEAISRYNEAADGKIGSATKRYVDGIYEAGNAVSHIFVEVDYTGNAPGGIRRSSLLCSFIKPSSARPFLFSVTVNNRDIQGFALNLMLVGSKRPSGLGPDLKLN